MFGKKKNKREKSDRLVRGMDMRRQEVNRKLIVTLFLGTAVVSVGLWGRTKWEAQKGGEWWSDLWRPTIIREDVKVNLPTPSSTLVQQKTTLERKELVAELREVAATASGTYAVYVYELEGEVGYGFNEREVMPGASILKLVPMIAALQKVDAGSWRLTTEFELKEIDRATGSGPLQFLPAGTKVTLDRMLSELGNKSDNTAWLMLNRLVGVAEIEDLALSLGMVDTAYRAGTTTALDVAKLLAKVYKGGTVSSLSRDIMWEDLTDSIYEDRIPAGIAESGVRVVHKVGTLADVWSDAAIIECLEASKCNHDPLILVILNKEITRGEAEEIVPKIARRVWHGIF